MYRKLAIHLKQPLKHWRPVMLLVTQKPQNYSGNDRLKQNCLFCRNICSTVEVLISPWQLESNITADWNFRACHIYVPDGRDFGAVNQCEFELLGLSEMGKRGRDANRCCFLEAGATTKHHEDMEKGLSDASKRDFLNKKLMHVQWSARSVSTVLLALSAAAARVAQPPLQHWSNSCFNLTGEKTWTLFSPLVK